MSGTSQVKVEFVSSANREPHRPPDRLADRYDVQEPIGEGASAITYRGWDDRLERVVAIKILREDVARDESYARRFRQEARAAASVSHGNVVDVYDFGSQDDVLYIVMQYVDGEDLKRLIERDAPLSPQHVRSIIGQVLDGLQAIHASGIVHRDIKPQNVLMGRDGIARVTDFGVAHVYEESGLTTHGTTVGTAAYMAPEQAQAGRVSEATDLYAVGVMMYEMLTGYLPFNGPTAMATMLEHIQRDPVPPSQRLPGHGITAGMDNVVMQALGKDPARRFNSARAMKQAVGAVFSHRQAGSSQTTVAAPAVRSSPPVSRRQQTRSNPAPASYQPSAAPAPAYPDRGPTRDEGAGVNGAAKGLLTVILIAVLAAAGWFLFDNLQNEGNGGDVAPTETIEVVQPSPTSEPTPTEDAPVLIEPPSPTFTPEPTPEPPTPTPTEEPTPEPTPEPTLESVPTETPDQGIIEPLDPMDITPFPTEP
jgi:tRNA A-37 threonylcarbamoyl transferase component Bud32